MGRQALTFRRRFKIAVTTRGHYLMAVLLVFLGTYLILPIVLLGLNSFNVAPNVISPPQYGFGNWIAAFRRPEMLSALGNTFLVFGSVTVIGMPIGVLIAWALARVRMPFSHGLEFGFWIAFIVPSISVTMGWIFLADPRLGLLNRALQELPFVNSLDGPLNIYSVPGIVWVHLMARSIADKVILLTPAFRNMDATLEEASRVAGASNLRTMLRVTFPVMTPPIIVVFALHLTRAFDGFEIEQFLGVPINFFVYSTRIYNMVSETYPPQYGQATALASVTLVIVALVVPLQRWLTQKHSYSVVTGSYKSGLINIGPARWIIFGGIVFLLMLMILAPVVSLAIGSIMYRAGIFSLNEVFSLRHWQFVMNEPVFWNAFANTMLLSSVTAVVGPFLFATIAYVLVRTKLPGRGLLDGMIWLAAVIPGMLAGLGFLWMFLGTPFLSPLYGTIWPLVIVMILHGKTTGTQLSKSVFLQMGADMEEAARVSGAGYVRTFAKIWVPLLMPTLILLGTLNFVSAATTTSSIILLATRGTYTLSLLALDYGSPGINLKEEAGIISLIIMTITIVGALIARRLTRRIGLQRSTIRG
ncbi:MAG TPA: iron ABC transporter permease [Alphaproteobacteria bacterium]